jgi:hypothetical protein
MHKRRLLVLFLLITVLIPVPSASVDMQSDGWETVGDGIAYRQFTLKGPNRAYVARLDRNNPNAIIESSIAKGRLNGGKETVSQMVGRYDQVINAWGGDWGPRNQVVVAINGSFYDVKTGVPWGGVIHSGWYAKRYGDFQGDSGFTWMMNRSSFISECITHPPDRQLVTNLITGESLTIDAINEPPDDSLTLFTPQYDRATPSKGEGVEILVGLTRPAGVLPYPAMATGIVREIWYERGPMPIPFDHVVLSAHGSAEGPLIDKFHLGEVVGLSAELDSWTFDCSQPLSRNWTKPYAAIAGNHRFLKGGEVKEVKDYGADQKAPRTAICFNDDFVFFVVVDGRDSSSIGMNMQELGRFCKDELGAIWGTNQDGGGSSTMWVNGEIVNHPSDGGERAVANGMMMVVVEPMEISDQFQVGDAVVAKHPSNLHLGPGDNYAAITSVPAGAVGVVQPHLNNLNGVLARGSYWWRVGFDGSTGWIQGDSLEANGGLTSSLYTSGTRYLMFVRSHFSPQIPSP